MSDGHFVERGTLDLWDDTMRAIGEIGHKTGFNMNMQLSARSDDQS